MLKKTIYLILMLVGLLMVSFISLRFMRYGAKRKILSIVHLVHKTIYKDNRIGKSLSSVEMIKSYLSFLFDGADDNLKLKNKKIGKYNLSFFNYFQTFYVFNEIFIDHTYYFKTERKSPLIIDLGSNIGLSIMYFKYLYPDAKIIAFEPSVKNFKLLKKNINDNGITDIEMHQKAVYDKETSLDLFDTGTVKGTLIKNNLRGSNRESIKTVVLSKYITKKVDLLKIDIEGCETLVIRELALNNKLNLIDNLIIEFHSRKENNDNQLHELLSILVKHGFVYQIADAQKTPFEKDLEYDLMIYAYKY